MNDTQQRILDAAIECVQQWGVEKTNLNDIAKQAGVTRPTVYRYFASRDDVLSAALLQSAHGLAQRLIAHVDRFKDPAERYLEAVLFALDAIPKEPYLAVATRADLSAYVSQDALTNAEGWALTIALTRQILEGADLTEEALAEITEMTSRVILSLLLMAGPQQRSKEELRKFLRRRLVPVLGLVDGR
jgi:AcrR family transcriptional regulator